MADLHEAEPSDLLVAAIGETTLSATQAEILYKATTRAMGDLATRIATNRYDEEALALLSDASAVAALLLRAVPRKKAAKTDE